MPFLAPLLSRLLILLGAWLALWGAWPWLTGDDNAALRIAAFVAGLLTVVLAGGAAFVQGRKANSGNTAVASTKNRENMWIRTSDFSFVALFFVVWTITAWPRANQSTLSGKTGTEFFEEFTDLTEVASLRIIAPNKERGTVDEFRIKRDEGGLFVIPSHGDYPVDAGEQLIDAATALFGLKKGEPVTDLPSEYAHHGVEEPKVGDLSGSDTGMGRLVEIRNIRDEVLAKLIIGKSVAGPGGYRFVREPSSRRVYRAKVDPTPFTTNFDDWIESDLLDIAAFDIANIGIRDYSWTDVPVQIGLAQRIVEQRMRLDIVWNQQAWDLESLSELGERGWVDSQLNEDEELNNDALNRIRSALEGLEIVDVQRKPAGLEAEIIPSSEDVAALSEERIAAINDAQEVLLDKGYWFRRTERDGSISLELFSSDGDLLVRTGTHVEYTLRFGRTLRANEGSTESDMRRFLMVSARVYTEGIPAPELITVPSLPGEEEEPAAADDESTPTPSAPLSPEEEENLVAERERIIAERERITRQNQRMIDEHAQAIATAEQRVRELNERFADWFYIISEEEFDKLHLGRSDAIQHIDLSTEFPTEEPQGSSLDEFRAIQQEGLSREIP